MNPFTHHDIMALAAPFAHSGRHVDLAASDRLKRRLAFKPVDRAAGVDVTAGASGDTSMPSPGMPMLREQLSLENASPGWFRLSRTLALPDGQCAELHCEGDESAILLAAVLAVPAQRQLPIVDGQQLVLRHRLDAASGRLILTHAQTAVAGLQLSMTVSRVSGISAEVELVAAPDENFELPEDLVSVLGLPWSRLSHKAGTWRASIVLRGDAAKRTQDAEAKFARTAAHLATVLAGTPAQFHQRFVRARWAVALRRLTPLLVATGLIVGALLVPRLNLGPDSVFRMLIFNAPPLLLVWLFTLREIPRLEIPPLPRPLSSRSWRTAGPAPAVPKDAPTPQATR
jgi:hypothetical protein